MMYVSTAPFLTVLHSSEQTEKMTIRTQLGTLEYRLRSGNDAALHFDEESDSDDSDKESDNDVEVGKFGSIENPSVNRPTIAPQGAPSDRQLDRHTFLRGDVDLESSHGVVVADLSSRLENLQHSHHSEVSHDNKSALISLDRHNTAVYNADLAAVASESEDQSRPKDAVVSSLALPPPLAPKVAANQSALMSAAIKVPSPTSLAPLHQYQSKANVGENGIVIRRRIASDASFVISRKQLKAMNAMTTPQNLSGPTAEGSSAKQPPNPPNIDLTDAPSLETRQRFLQAYIMRHTFFILLAIFICTFSEDKIMTDHPGDFNIFYIIFEIVSAYGNVGMSMGVPGEPYSMSGAFSTLGKVIVIATMMLGKCRGLPKRNDIVIDFRFKHLRRLAGLTRKHHVRVKDALKAVATRIPLAREGIAAAFRKGANVYSRGEASSAAASAKNSVDESFRGRSFRSRICASIARQLSLTPSAAARLFAGRPSATPAAPVGDIESQDTPVRATEQRERIRVDRCKTTLF